MTEVNSIACLFAPVMQLDPDIMANVRLRLMLIALMVQDAREASSGRGTRVFVPIRSMVTMSPQWWYKDHSLVATTVLQQSYYIQTMHEKAADGHLAMCKSTFQAVR